MFRFRRFVELPKLSRKFATTAILNKNDPRSLVKLKKIQADFQIEDGKPIWLKGGITDRILYSSTIILAYVGILNVLVFLYEQAKPASWKKSPC